MENYMNHFWLGNNELVIIRYQERYQVIEMYEDWKEVFTGKYMECLEYCKNREVEYMESIIG